MQTRLAYVSRETLDRLDVFQDLVVKWNPAINLVSKASLADIKSRHIEDSAQLLDVMPADVLHWVDLGSGGGFPGIVVAILLAEINPGARVTMVESDQRKAAFLRASLRETQVEGSVISERIEELKPLGADVVSARALAPLDALLPLALTHLKPGGTAIFPKGRRWQEEVDAAKSRWKFEYRVDMNKIEPDAVILSIQGVSRV